MDCLHNTRLKNKVQNFDIEHNSKLWASTQIFLSPRNIVMGSNRNHGFESWGLDYHYLDQEKFNESIILNTDPKTRKD